MTTSTGGARRVSGADAAHLVLEQAGGVDTVGILGLLDAGPLLTPAGAVDVDRLRNVLAPRVAALAPLNRRLAPQLSPGRGRRRPSWQASPADLAVHVRTASAITDEQGLADLGAQALQEPLDRRRPLWDLVVVPGPGPAQVALALRLHHAVADGVSAAGIAARLFDPVPAARHPSGPARPVVDRTPRTLRSMRGVTGTLAMAARPLPRTSLLGPLGPGRRIGLVEADLQRVRARAHARGATVNDVLLDAVAAAAEALIRSRGERVPRAVRASVPVALDRLPGDEAANRVGVMVVPLPLRKDDAGDRLAGIAAVTRREAPRARAAGTLPLLRGRPGARVMTVLSRHQRLVALFVTDVRGPREPLSLAGAEVTSAWPLSSLAGNVRLAVAAMTYADRLSVTVVADAASTPDVDVFTSALRTCLTAPGA